MHIPRDYVLRLTDAFKTKYNRDLICHQLRQLHSDFPGIHQDRSDVYTIESYFIWKKVHSDMLSTCTHHIRLKSIPTARIELEINKSFDGDPMKLYKYLFEGNEVVFDCLKLVYD